MPRIPYNRAAVGRGEEASVATEQLSGHRSLAKRRREVGQFDNSWQHAGKDAALLRPVDRAFGHACVDELAHRRNTELCGEQSQCFRPVEHPTVCNGFHNRPGRRERTAKRKCADSLIPVTTLVAPIVPMTLIFAQLSGQVVVSVWRRNVSESQ